MLLLRENIMYQSQYLFFSSQFIKLMCKNGYDVQNMIQTKANILISSMGRVAYVCIIMWVRIAGSELCLPSCEECTVTGDCMECSMLEYVGLGSPPSLGCLPCMPGCLTCSSPTSGCFSCLAGYYLQHSTCLPCISHCSSCSSVSPTICTVCQEGYYLISSNGQCQSCTTYPHALTCRQNIILACESGYYVQAGQQCLECGDGCVSCISNSYCLECVVGRYGYNCQYCTDGCEECVSSTKCITCETGLYLSRNLCQQCDEHPRCRSCTSTGECLSCENGYYLTATNVCLDIPEPFFIFACLLYSYDTTTLQFQCSTCESGYYVSSSGKCLECSLLCQECTGWYPTSECTFCREAASLPTHGVCTVLRELDSYHVRYVSVWNHPSLWILSGDTVLVLEDQCPVNTLYQSNSILLPMISGYGLQVQIRLSITISTLPSILTLNYTLNGETFTSTVDTSKLILCSTSSTSVYTVSESASLSASLSTSNNLTISVGGAYLTIIQMVYMYRPCHETCMLCQSWYSCTQCYDSSLYLQEEECVEQCSELYYVQPATKQCVTSCPAGTYEDQSSSVWQCSSCPSQCIMCVSDSECVSCEQGFYLYEGQCLISCPIRYYPNQLSHRCSQCQSPCYSCSSDDVCQTCSVYFLHESTCVNACPSTYYPNLTSLSCQPCQQPCVECQSYEYCLSCIDGLLVYEGQCVASCDENYVGISGVCVRCQSPCYECEQSITQCSRCETGFRWQGTCTFTCPSQTYQSFSTMSCVACSQSCRTCTNQPSACTSCKEELVLHPTLQLCVSLSECEQMKGYFYDEATMLCTECMAECVDCAGYQNCTQCSSNYYLLSTQCLSQCPSTHYADYQLRTCTECHSNCLTCIYDSKYCLSCNENYLLTEDNECQLDCGSGKLSTTCQLCEYPCEECMGEVNHCTSCVDGFVLYTLEAVCLTQCYPGYYNDGGICEECVAPCDGCVSITECISCGIDSQGVYYYLKVEDVQNGVGTCVAECPDYYYSHEESKLCKLCESPCEKCSSPTACITCSNGVLEEGNCLESCSFGRYVVLVDEIEICVLCSTPCQSCDTDICLTCVQGYYLLEGQCVEVCLSGTVPISSTRTCQPCQYPCKQCENSIEECTVCSQPSNCTSCTTYFLWESECVLVCPSTSYTEGEGCVACVSPCYTCSSMSVCTSCIQQYYLQLGECVSTCVQGYYGNSLTMECQKCVYPCKQCDSLSVCLSCVEGVLYDGECILSNECPEGYFVAQDGSFSCEKCDSACVRCEDTADYCLQCISAPFLLDGACVEYCPTGYYPLPLLKSCAGCASECSSCSSISECYDCVSGYYLLQNTCVQICPPTYYHAGDVCQQCCDGCKSCFNSCGNCLSCEYGLWLYQLACHQSCNVGQYEDTDAGVCRECEYPCAECLAPTVCQLCLGGFYLNQFGFCVEVCPTTHYIDSTSTLCIASCPEQQYAIHYQTHNKCQTVCQYPQILYNGTCIHNCSNAGLYINQHLHCIKVQNIGEQALPSAIMSVIKKEDNMLYLLVSFNQQVEYTNIQSLEEVMQVTVYGDEVWEVSFTVQTQASRYLLLKLEMGSSVQGELIRVSFLTNANLRIISSTSSIPLQSSAYEAELPAYEMYPYSYNAHHFSIFGEVLIDFILIVGFFLLLWNWYAKIYEFLHYGQVVWMLLMLQVLYPPNLLFFLQGYGGSHFYQVGNWLIDQDYYDQLADAPMRIRTILIDGNFIRVWGHIFCLALVLIACTFFLFLGSLFKHVQNSTLRRFGENLAYKLSLIKWSHIHDFVVSVTMITMFAFMTQIYDYSPTSSLQILGVIVSYLVVALMLGYYIYMGYYLHELVKMSESDPRRFCDKRYLFQPWLLSITEAAVHPKELYLNYWRVGRILLVGMMSGLLGYNAGFCLGVFALGLLVSGCMYFMVKPYPDTLQNILLGSADFLLLVAIVFISLIHFNTDSHPSFANLGLKWALGWVAIIFIILGHFVTLTELVVSIIRGNNGPQQLPAEDININTSQALPAPKRLIMMDKKQFDGWECEEGSILGFQKAPGSDRVKES